MTQSTWTPASDGISPVVVFQADGFDYIDHWPTREEDENADDCGRIVFQHGPRKEFGDNGTTIELVIEAITARLRAFNDNPTFRCRENSLAITHLEEAMHWLEARTKARQAQAVEGRNIPHVS